jgi:hypothetical protein
VRNDCLKKWGQFSPRQKNLAPVFSATPSNFNPYLKEEYASAFVTLAA